MSAITRRLWAWWLLALLLAAGFAWLGRWQLARMHEKQTMLAQAQQALDHSHPQPLLLASDSKRASNYDWSSGQGRIANVTVWLDTLFGQNVGSALNTAVVELLAGQGDGQTVVAALKAAAEKE